MPALPPWYWATCIYRNSTYMYGKKNTDKRWIFEIKNDQFEY